MRPEVPEQFHPLIRRWFSEVLGAPTAVQLRTWDEVQKGRHVLVTAPTGSGKTLAAFLWAINQLVTGAWPAGETGVLYVSPLRALNNDVRRNLIAPLDQLKERFRAQGLDFPPLKVLTRSGDTPADERRRMLRSPPEILITTPESLNILLASKGSRHLLTGIRTVILDEIHAVADSKRGTHLVTALERLVPLSGEFQRIALSATVRPLETVAQFVGGFEEVNGRYRRRPVALVRGERDKRFSLEIIAPLEEEGVPGEDFWHPLVKRFCRIIGEHDSTLFFANSRRTTERVTRLINEEAGEELAWAHHGSLSREIRLAVEERLKRGELKAIVATNSLELGIDIGRLDCVVLIQTPRSISSAIQRIGRSGHRVGEVSRGLLYPTQGMDFVAAAVLARCIADGEIEELRPVEAPLDLLAQIILSMGLAETWDLDELYALLKTSYPYRNLERRQFDLVVGMLEGRYADSHVHELRPRATVDRLSNTIATRPALSRLIFMEGGTIPERGYFDLRLRETGAKIGELDEEFVWERRIGDTFSLGAQVWQITEITHSAVQVVPARRTQQIIPFWRAEELDRDFFYSERIGSFLEECSALLAGSPTPPPGMAPGGPNSPSPLAGSPTSRRSATTTPNTPSPLAGEGGGGGEAATGEIPIPTDASSTSRPLISHLMTRYFMDRGAAQTLGGFLSRQREATGRELPHRHHLLVEQYHDPNTPAEERQVILHTLWGNNVNRPFTLALCASWQEKYGYPLQAFYTNDAVALLIPHQSDLRAILDLVQPERVETLLRGTLEASAYFGARFRENAGRALLLPKTNFKRRMPLWLNRMRAKKLLAAVQRYRDFPVLVETWRASLQEDFDLNHLKELLRELRDGEIRVSESRTEAPSPFAHGLVWSQTNKYLYQDDTPDLARPSSLDQDLLKELASSAQLRPRIPLSLIREFEAKQQRTAPGYTPENGHDLVDWVKERFLIPVDEWRKLLSAMQRDHGVDPGELLAQAAGRLALLSVPGGALPLVAALELLPELARGLGREPGELGVAPLLEDQASREAFERSLAKLAARKGAAGAGAAGRDEDPATERLLGTFLCYYGPVELFWLRRTLALPEQRLREALHGLEESGVVLLDQFSEEHLAPGSSPLYPRDGSPPLPRPDQPMPTSGNDAPIPLAPSDEPIPLTLRERGRGEGEGVTEICDAANLETLLRMLRWSRRAPFEALGLESLPLFLACHQGLTRRGAALDDLRGRLDQLLGLPLPADAWEEELLPARLEPYFTPWLDSLMQTSDLLWFGCGSKRLSFAFPEELPLFAEQGGHEPAEEAQLLARLFPDPRGRYSLPAICLSSALPSATVNADLWRLAWRGEITNDSFASVRKGVLNKFASHQSEPAATLRHPLARRWHKEQEWTGNWYLLPREKEAADPLEREELNRERVRVLLDRYGILFRELLQRELPPLQWRGLFRALRIMELSGELLAGHFFDGIPGLQFMSREAFRLVSQGLPGDAVYWMNALDPASLCGIGLEALPDRLPARLPSTHLVYRGTHLVLVSKRYGKDLEILVPPDDPRLPDYLSFFRTLLSREFNPLKRVFVERINGEPAARSPYADALRSFGFQGAYKGLELWRRY